MVFNFIHKNLFFDVRQSKQILYFKAKNMLVHYKGKKYHKVIQINRQKYAKRNELI